MSSRSTARRREITIRRTLPADVDALVVMCAEHAEFERSAYAAEGKARRLHTALFAPEPRLFAWLAVIDEFPVGYAAASAEYSTWGACEYLHMDCLFVRARQRGAGIGAALMDSVVQMARQRGFGEVQWQTPQWNADASRFYRRHGALEAAKLRFVLEVGRDPL
jgi:GNAT superfamily N-acetyltransferase